MLLGVAGFVLSLINFRRDKHHLRVALKWYVSGSPPNATSGYIRVWNDGRRPIQIAQGGLTVSDGEKPHYVPLHLFSLSQKIISESEFADFPFTLAEHGISDSWYNVGAFVQDYAGQQHTAKSLGATRP